MNDRTRFTSKGFATFECDDEDLQDGAGGFRHGWSAKFEIDQPDSQWPHIRPGELMWLSPEESLEMAQARRSISEGADCFGDPMDAFWDRLIDHAGSFLLGVVSTLLVAQLIYR